MLLYQLTTRFSAKHNQGTDVPPLAFERSDRYRIQLRQQLQIVSMWIHRALVRAKGFCEDELIMLSCSFPTMRDIALMGVILLIPGQIGLRRRSLRVTSERSDPVRFILTFSVSVITFLRQVCEVSVLVEQTHQYQLPMDLLLLAVLPPRHVREGLRRR